MAPASGGVSHADQELRLYREIFAASSDAIAVIGPDGQYREQNNAHRKLLGYSDDELRGKTPALHMGQEVFERVARELALSGHFRGEMTCRKKSGEPVEIELSAFSMRNDAGEVLCHVGIKREISGRKKIEHELRSRVRQQAAVVEFGQRALAGADESTLMDYAVKLVADTLQVEYCKILQLVPGEKDLLLRAGHGWKEGCVGQLLEPGGKGSQGGFALLSSEPLIVEDLRKETRFQASPLLAEHQVVSGMSVIIGPLARPLGVLGAHSRSCREFTHDDINFLQAIANILATATARSRAEQALQSNQQRLRLAQEATRMAAWDWDVSTGAITWTEGSADVYGLRPEALKDLESWRKRIHPEDQRRVLQALRQALAERTEFDMEFRVFWPDGSTHWLAGRGQVFREGPGAPLRMIGINLDVTARKEAAEALRHSEERFRRAQKSANIAAYEWNVRTGEVKWSEELPVLRGLAADGKFATWLSHLHPQDLQALKQSVRNAPRDSGEFDVQARFLLPGHNIVWVVLRGQVFYDAAGQPSQVLGIVLDITARKQAEEILQRSEKLAMLGRLAATIAHEINNPLEAVTNLLYLLEHHHGADEVARHYASLAQQELQRVSHIARQTLGFHRESMKPIPVSLTDVVDNVLRLHERKIEVGGIRINKRFDFSGEVRAFPAEMRQVFSNLVLNSLEAVGEGGRVAVHVYRSRDWRHPEQRGVRVVIADDGPGIRAEHRHNIFEPFFTTKGEKGTGLGLWVTNGIVHKHGGHIRMRTSTRPGRSGTTFSVFLPDNSSARISELIAPSSPDRLAA